MDADASYGVQFSASAVAELVQLSKIADRKKILARIEGFAAEPRPNRCEEMEGRNRLRLRLGFFRILYEVDDEDRKVRVVKIRRRREV